MTAEASGSPRIGIVALTPESWGGQMMGRHQVLTRLSRRFPVVWVNRRPGWRAAARALIHHTFISPVRAPIPSLPEFRVLAPSPFLPKIYRPHLAKAVFDRLSVLRATRRLTAAGCTRVVLSVWRPDFVGEVLACRDLPVVYHIADEYSFSPVERPIASSERAILSRCDAAICVSEALAGKKASLAARSFVVPNGVDYGLFSSPVGEPTSLAKLPRPRIAYVGSIKKQLNLSLIANLAQRRPQWTFALVGPIGNVRGVEQELEDLRNCSNVVFLGYQESSRLPAFMQHVDVAMMPYVVDDYTKYISPLKLYEYLATGTPIVSSPITAATELEPHVRVVHDVSGWETAIAEALSEATMRQDARADRQRIAAEFDWGAITDRVGDIIELVASEYD